MKRTLLTYATSAIAAVTLFGCTESAQLDDNTASRVAIDSINLDHESLSVSSIDRGRVALVYDDGRDVHRVELSSSTDDANALRPVEDMFARMSPAFRDRVYRGAIGDELPNTSEQVISTITALLKKWAWVGCVKWCLFVDGEDAIPCTIACCADQNLAPICGVP